MHTVQLLLKPTTYERAEIERRFHAVSHIHNVCVKRMRKQIVLLLKDEEYRNWRTEYGSLSKIEKPSKAEKERKKALASDMNTRRTELGLNRSELEKYIKVCGARYKKLLSSQQVQAEAANVWKGVEDFLFSNGKQLHFKKFRDFRTIGGKSNINGICYDTETRQIQWLGLQMQCYLPKKASDREYVLQSLDHKISYCMIKRQMFSNGWRYHIILVLKADAPQKLEPGFGDMGIDPGVSTMACTADTGCVLEELAPETDRYDRQIQEILRKMDRSRRKSNPDKYNPDGTVKKNDHSRWKNSKNYIRLLRRLQILYRKRSQYILTSHRTLCNRLIQMADRIRVERMTYKALQKRSKKTEHQDKISEVKKKDGSVVMIRKFKKKKRFGRSINRRAPSLFLTELERKITTAGGTYEEVKTETFKASQYDHSTDECTKIPLKQRTKVIDGHEVQRDLYSGFLIKNADDSLEHPDREKCKEEFLKFIEMHDELIKDMKRSGVSMKQCFGF